MTGAGARAADAACAAARVSYGRLVALLAAADRDVAAAEDALADAFERALRTWPEQGVPANPDGWLFTVARNRLRDRWSSAEVTRTRRLDAEHDDPGHVDEPDLDVIEDKRLELIFVCAHPAIDATARTPLMLNTVLGHTAEQIARVFTVPTATMATRLTRAKRRIKVNGIPFRVPEAAERPQRLADVCEAVYGAYAIEWSITGTAEREPVPQGLQLAEVLAQLLPDDPEVRGLAALVHLSAARRAARVDDDGVLVPLAEQDPARWDAALVARGREHLRAAHGHAALGRFQLEAAIQAVHCARIDGHEVDGHTLLDLHRALVAIVPSLGSRTSLAAVTGTVAGPRAGLAVLDELGAAAERFQPAWATRAHLLAELGRVEEADGAYRRAVALTQDPPARRHLERKRAGLHPR